MPSKNALALFVVKGIAALAVYIFVVSHVFKMKEIFLYLGNLPILVTTGGLGWFLRGSTGKLRTNREGQEVHVLFWIAVLVVALAAYLLLHFLGFTYLFALILGLSVLGFLSVLAIQELRGSK